MLLILGTIRLPLAKNGNMIGTEARAAMHDMIHASRQEDGCFAYSYAEDLLVPGLIRVHEIWRGRVALDAHFETKHLAQWRARWPALGIHDRDLHLYETALAQPI